jgi:hypothetical protein
MKPNLKKLVTVGMLAAAWTSFLPAAQITLVTVGGNASIKLITNRIPTILNGAVLTTNTNSLIFRFTGNLNVAGPYNGQSVQWDFNLTGGAGAILDIANQTPVPLADGSTGIPTHVITVTAPETIGVDSTPFTEDVTIVAPLVYIKSTLAGNDLAGITNITQRNAAYLESSGGTLPTAYFGGTNTTTPLYFVGRNSSAAVRQVIDANIYFSGTAANWNTNGGSPNLPVPYVDGQGNPSGASSGTEVANLVKAITNSIGTVAAQDINSLPALSYEGVPFSPANVINGSYPLWGYERYIYYTPGTTTLAPSSPQLALIQALEAAVEDPTFQNTSSLFTNKFVSYNAVNASVSRSLYGDGGPITSTQY